MRYGKAANVAAARQMGFAKISRELYRRPRLLGGMLARASPRRPPRRASAGRHEAHIHGRGEQNQRIPSPAQETLFDPSRRWLVRRANARLRCTSLKERGKTMEVQIATTSEKARIPLIISASRS